MSFRRSVIGLLGAAVLAVAACSSGVPSGGSLALPSITIPSGALPSVALEGFCAEFASKIEATWPNIDASTATALAPVVSQWAAKPEMASVQADVTTIATWISAAATATSVSSPPPDVMTAFDHLKAFADANC
jgi:ABC-type glycerol-3-phosphate transport system substrate-binding protein